MNSGFRVRGPVASAAVRYWLLGAAAVLLVAAGIVVANLPINATFAWTGDNRQGQLVTVPDSGSCITAWDDFIGHYGPPLTDTSTYGPQNDAAYSAACWSTIDARKRVAWTLVVLAGLPLIVMAVLYLGSRRSPALQSTNVDSAAP